MSYSRVFVNISNSKFKNQFTIRYLLAVLHAINCLLLPLQSCKLLFMWRQRQKRLNFAKKDPNAKMKKSFVLAQAGTFISKYIVNPVLVGFILYGREILGGGHNYYGVRVCIAFSLINTSYLFLSSIGTLPTVGSYTNLISKVIFRFKILFYTSIIFIFYSDTQKY